MFCATARALFYSIDACACILGRTVAGVGAKHGPTVGPRGVGGSPAPDAEPQRSGPLCGAHRIVSRVEWSRIVVCCELIFPLDFFSFFKCRIISHVLSPLSFSCVPCLEQMTTIFSMANSPLILLTCLPDSSVIYLCTFQLRQRQVEVQL